METKNQIITAAYEMFQERGYDNVTVNDICQRCNITKPTFYRYIESKDQLLAYFYENIAAEITQQFMKMLAADNYWEQFCMGFDTILQHSRRFGADLYSHLFISNLREPKGTFDFDDMLTQAMTSVLSKAQQHGQVRNGNDPGELYMACANMCFGYGILWCLNRGKNDLIRDFRIALENVCDVEEAYRMERLQSI